MLFEFRIVVSSFAFFLFRLVGLLLLGAGFALPSCRDSSGAVHPGWLANWAGMLFLSTSSSFDPWNVPAMLSGLLTPLAAVALLFSFSRKLYGWKFACVGLMLASIVVDIFYQFHAHLIPLAGRFLWYAGALVIGFSAAFMMTPMHHLPEEVHS